MSTNVNARYLGSSFNVNVNIFFTGMSKKMWQQYIVKHGLLKTRHILRKGVFSKMSTLTLGTGLLKCQRMSTIGGRGSK